jgi:hypothetical protein
MWKNRKIKIVRKEILKKRKRAGERKKKKILHQ